MAEAFGNAQGLPIAASGCWWQCIDNDAMIQCKWGVSQRWRGSTIRESFPVPSTAVIGPCILLHHPPRALSVMHIHMESQLSCLGCSMSHMSHVDASASQALPETTQTTLRTTPSLLLGYFWSLLDRPFSPQTKTPPREPQLQLHRTRSWPNQCFNSGNGK